MKKLLLISLFLILPFVSSKAQWTEFNTYFPYSLFDVSFADPVNGFAVGEQGSVLRTTDGAESWEVVLTVPGKWFRSVHNYASNSVIACGSFGAVYLSLDNGVNWTDMSLGSDVHLNDIKIIGGQAYTVGYAGAFYISPSPGVWNPPVTQIPYTMNSIDASPAFLGDGRAIITCVDGLVYRTTNFGTNWVLKNLQQQGIYDYLNRVKFITTDIAVIVGNNGRVLRTTNWGGTWTNIPHGLTGQHLRDVDAVFNGVDFTLVAVGDAGTIIRSGDGGLTWAVQLTSPLTSRHLYGVSLPFITAGYIVGEVGTYAEAAAFMNDNLNVGISNNGGVVPSQYNLSQNFPNPFNPETKISFDIPKSSFVKLTVFDISGREIENLVNENLNAGSYTFSFNGKNLTSGAYFYRLTAEGFTSTKKMLLVK